MAEHTPGPWEWRTNAGRVYLRTVNRGGLYIMDFVRRGMQGAQPRFAVWKGEDREKLGGIMMAAGEIDFRNHPDARLIAAAPELLEVVRALLKACDEDFIANTSHQDSLGVLADAARAAIAKATEAA